MKKIIIGLLAVLMLVGCKGKKNTGPDLSGDKLYCVLDPKPEGGSSEVTAYYEDDEILYVTANVKTPQATKDIEVILATTGLITAAVSSVKGLKVELSANDAKDVLITTVDVDYKQMDWEAFRKLAEKFNVQLPAVISEEDRSLSNLRAKAEAGGFTCN